MSSPSIHHPRSIEQRKLAVISINHMTATDNELLASDPESRPGCFQADYEQGWIFCVPEDEDETTKDWPLSPGLLENLLALKRAGFERVEFDRDFDQVSGLQVFDW